MVGEQAEAFGTHISASSGVGDDGPTALMERLSKFRASMPPPVTDSALLTNPLKLPMLLRGWLRNSNLAAPNIGDMERLKIVRLSESCISNQTP